MKTIINGHEIGTLPFLVHENIHCSDCGGIHDIEMCPVCGSTIEIGYGLCFDGMGLYKFCHDSFGIDCRWRWKKQDEE